MAVPEPVEHSLSSALRDLKEESGEEISKPNKVR